jgi:hypothetical protein
MSKLNDEFGLLAIRLNLKTLPTQREELVEMYDEAEVGFAGGLDYQLFSVNALDKIVVIRGRERRVMIPYEINDCYWLSDDAVNDDCSAELSFENSQVAMTVMMYRPRDIDMMHRADFVFDDDVDEKERRKIIRHYRAVQTLGFVGLCLKEGRIENRKLGSDEEIPSLDGAVRSLRESIDRLANCLTTPVLRALAHKWN